MEGTCVLQPPPRPSGEEELIIQRPALPGEGTPPCFQRIELKRTLLEILNLPNSEHLYIHKEDQPWSRTEEKIHLWFRVWLLSDADLYFFLGQIRRRKILAKDDISFHPCDTEGSSISRTSTTTGVDNHEWEPFIHNVSRRLRRTSTVQNERMSILLAQKAICSVNSMARQIISIKEELLSFIDKRIHVFISAHLPLPITSIVNVPVKSIPQSLGIKLNENISIVHHSDFFGMGFLANNTIPAGELVISVPQSNLFSIYTALLDKPDETCACAGITFSGLIALFLDGRIVDATDDEIERWKASALAPLFSKTASVGLQTDEHFLLVLFILYEYGKKQKSRFYDYFSNLSSKPGCIPVEAQNLLVADSRVADLLDIPEISQSLQAAKDNMDEMYHWFSLNLPRLAPNLFAEKDFEPGANFSYEHFKWAIYITETRELELTVGSWFPTDRANASPSRGGSPTINQHICTHPKRTTPELPLLPGVDFVEYSKAEPGRELKDVSVDVVLWRVRTESGTYENVQKQVKFKISESVGIIAPIFDLLNHHVGAQCAHPQLVDGQFQARSSLPISSGSQIFLCYGAHENWSLLRYYGFCPVALSPSDTMTIELDVDDTTMQQLSKYMVPVEHLLHYILYTPDELHGLSYEDILDVSGLNTLIIGLRVCLGLLGGESKGSSDQSSSVFTVSSLETETDCLEQLGEILDNLYSRECEKMNELEVQINQPYILGWGSRLATILNHRMAILKSNRELVGYLQARIFQTSS